MLRVGDLAMAPQSSRGLLPGFYWGFDNKGPYMVMYISQDHITLQDRQGCQQMIPHRFVTPLEPKTFDLDKYV